jgi:prepilin-type N-terminal cleavage/methylation domain-containing protein
MAFTFKQGLGSKRGFTLAETLISVAIIGVLAGLSMTAFATFARKESLDSNAAALAAALRDARARTIASVGGMQHGIYIESSRFVLFQGSSYSSTATTNVPFNWSSAVKASSTLSSIVFEKVTGNSSASGTIELYLVPSYTVKKSVTIQSGGLVNVQ